MFFMLTEKRLRDERGDGFHGEAKGALFVLHPQRLQFFTNAGTKPISIIDLIPENAPINTCIDPESAQFVREADSVAPFGMGKSYPYPWDGLVPAYMSTFPFPLLRRRLTVSP